MYNIVDKNIVRLAIKKRKSDAHKYSVGSLMCFCGSYLMAGAAIMCGKSALRSGIGLLKMAVSDNIYPIIAQSIPEAVFIKNDDEFLAEKMNKSSAVLIGCGLSTSDFAKSLVEKVLTTSEKPIIIDADGLNILAENLDLLRKVKVPVVITPHNMEMARLCHKSIDEVVENRIEVAKSFSKEYNVITVLKGEITYIVSPDGEIFENSLVGNCGMATAGSGDVLAGIIASFIAQGSPLYKGACAGVYIHSLAGDMAKEKFGVMSLLATDIIDFIPDALKKCGF